MFNSLDCSDVGNHPVHAHPAEKPPKTTWITCARIRDVKPYSAASSKFSDKYLRPTEIEFEQHHVLAFLLNSKLLTFQLDAFYHIVHHC